MTRIYFKWERSVKSERKHFDWLAPNDAIGNLRKRSKLIGFIAFASDRPPIILDMIQIAVIDGFHNPINVWHIKARGNP